MKQIILNDIISRCFSWDEMTGFTLIMKHKDKTMSFAIKRDSKSSAVYESLSAINTMILDICFPNFESAPCSPKAVMYDDSDRARLMALWEKMGYKTQAVENAGGWTWLNVDCKHDEIEYHVLRLQRAIAQLYGVESYDGMAIENLLHEALRKTRANVKKRIQAGEESKPRSGYGWKKDLYYYERVVEHYGKLLNEWAVTV